ncbi:MAG: hypothetical protein H7343_23950, partial [Undibacterium sp.]|nr:hypothetical protein [Opitutaceae bacterium]
MNDSKFIELLNLFLDHEIAPADAKLLEAEVLRSPARRRVYREYCKMQKACVVLAESAAAAPTSSDFTRPEIAIGDRLSGLGPWGPGSYAAGFCALAACLALAVVIRNGNGAPAAARRSADPAAVANVLIPSPVAPEQLRR